MLEEGGEEVTHVTSPLFVCVHPLLFTNKSPLSTGSPSEPHSYSGHRVEFLGCAYVAVSEKVDALAEKGSRERVRWGTLLMNS